MKKITKLATLACLAMAFMQSCVPQIKPNVWAAELYAANKPTIHILPLVDNRPDTTESGNFNRWATNTSSRLLQKKGYKTVVVKQRSGLEDDQLRGLRDTVVTPAEKQLVAALGPSNAEWLFLPVLQDYHRKIVLGCKATTDVSGYLFEKKTGKTVLWHKTQGEGSAGLLLCPLAGQMAIETGFSNVCYAFPKNPAPKK